MALEAPTIDDRTYDDIVEEIRARIPRYTEEWTDLNDSDPGIVFSQLFAWLADQLLYRLGKVPEANYVKFLQLLGFELDPAQPAVAEITFPVDPAAPDPFVIVPLRTQLSTEAPDDDGPIVFETDSAATAVRAQLLTVLVSEGASNSLVTELNEEADASFKPFGQTATIGNALMLGFHEALPNVDIDLAFWVGQGRAQTMWQCGEPPTAFSPPPIEWQYWNGSEWTGTTLLVDDTDAFTRTGHVQLKSPGDAMQPAVIAPETEARYWLRGRLLRSVHDSPPQLLAVRTNTVSATQAQSIRNEVLGASDGSPDQTFRLSSAPVVAGSLELSIDEGLDEERVWTEVPDLFGCGPADTCFTLNRTTGEVRFGDGVRFGDIPLANPNNPNASIVAVQYRMGGGTRGNVGAGAINSLLSSVASVDQSGVGNVRPAEGGSDEETLRELEVRARQTLSHNDRAVATEDFEALAREAANIGRAKALPLFHPAYPDIEVPGVVTVIVIPKRSTEPGDRTNEVRDPMPGELTLQAVCDYLDRRRLMTTELYVIAPTYRLIEVSGEVIAEDDADRAALFNAIEDDLLTFLDPLTGGRSGDGWPFGGTVFYSQVLQRVASIEGVRRVAQLAIVIDGEEQEPCVDVEIGASEIVYSESNSNITVEYETGA